MSVVTKEMIPEDCPLVGFENGEAYLVFKKFTGKMDGEFFEMAEQKWRETEMTFDQRMLFCCYVEKCWWAWSASLYADGRTPSEAQVKRLETQSSILERLFLWGATGK